MHIMDNLVWRKRALLDVLVPALERNQLNDETQNDNTINANNENNDGF